jgi:hypothetical protein
MDERNGDCFDHHEDLFAPLSASDSEHDCLKEFLLEPSQPITVPPSLSAPIQPVQNIPWNNGQIQYQSVCNPTDLNPILDIPINHNLYGSGGFVEQIPVAIPVDTSDPIVDKNGDCWSPVGFAASASERTVSSDCVSSETVCSPSEGTSDSPSPCKPCSSAEEPVKKRGRKRKSGSSPRGRPRATVATYQSQIAPDQNGIKIRIKKSLALVPPKSRKKKHKEETVDEYVEPEVQSGWGERLPQTILYDIFEMVTRTEGCVPFLVR